MPYCNQLKERYEHFTINPAKTKPGLCAAVGRRYYELIFISEEHKKITWDKLIPHTQWTSCV